MAAVLDGPTRFTDLPVAPMDRPWDGSAARSRLAKWASSDGSGDKDKIDWTKFAKGFFWFDSSAPNDLGSYKLPFVDVVDGRSGTFALDGPEGKTFICRSRLFTDEELAALAANQQRSTLP